MKRKVLYFHLRTIVGNTEYPAVFEIPYFIIFMKADNDNTIKNNKITSGLWQLHNSACFNVFKWTWSYSIVYLIDRTIKWKRRNGFCHSVVNYPIYFVLYLLLKLNFVDKLLSKIISV